MKREGFELRYLYVLERQKERGEKEGNEGSIHAHIIIFNDEYIPFEVINKHWDGVTDVHMLDGLRMENGKNKEKITDAGAYICKYITKEANLEWGSRCFSCSKGLKKSAEIPVRIYGDGNGTYFKEEKLDELFNGFMDMCDIVYQDAQVVRYCGSEGVVTQIIDYKQGNFKGSNLNK